ncbi:unnamed protein product [Acanthosepion pharaonis]|uniref:Uncharacterized protein n=1 Tax=Acanthosepion pharaonis TaxID=158019 RepID=A0A812DF74_ACAPH|nr:unnamed protein product [Sepia pharaonis]
MGIPLLRRPSRWRANAVAAMAGLPDRPLIIHSSPWSFRVADWTTMEECALFAINLPFTNVQPNETDRPRKRLHRLAIQSLFRPRAFAEQTAVTTCPRQGGRTSKVVAERPSVAAVTGPLHLRAPARFRSPWSDRSDQSPCNSPIPKTYPDPLVKIDLLGGATTHGGGDDQWRLTHRPARGISGSGRSWLEHRRVRPDKGRRYQRDHRRHGEDWRTQPQELSGTAMTGHRGRHGDQGNAGAVDLTAALQKAFRPLYPQPVRPVQLRRFEPAGIAQRGRLWTGTVSVSTISCTATLPTDLTLPASMIDGIEVLKGGEPVLRHASGGRGYQRRDPRLQQARSTVSSTPASIPSAAMPSTVLRARDRRSSFRGICHA